MDSTTAHDKLVLLINQRLAQGAETEPERELARLLRARLIFFNVFVFAPTFLVFMLVMTGAAEAPHWRLGDKLMFALVSLGTCSLGTLAIAARRASLARLRLLEVATFTLVAGALLWGQYLFFQGGWLPELDDVRVMYKIMELFADGYSHPWFLLIVFYGACIPNTTKRTAVVVFVLSLLPVLMLLVVAGQGASYSPYLLEKTLPKTIFALSTGAAIAIYGSHHISKLRRESYEARQLGRYVLKEQLGAGGMGEVYLAEHQLLKRPCAVKIIRPEKAGDPRALLRFAREVQATAALTNPHVVEVFDYGNADDGTFYYVMEYLPGISLQELVNEFGVLPQERVVSFLMQMCLALREAHGRGLIHRDIKPSNIIVGTRGGVPDVAKLVDFGLVHAPSADQFGTLTQPGAVLGSPLYMSPEQAGGADDLDSRSDLYSLGLVGYFLLTGVNPFKRANVQAIFAAQVRDPAPLPRDYAPAVGLDVQSVIMHCLEKDPAARFADAESLRDALAACACAELWTEERARAWWQEHQPDQETADATHAGTTDQQQSPPSAGPG